ncbi:MAG: hypothetical protein OXN17_18880 [Candidatus Poribacteria bacterium]|nr:hypothetical protein [Candidatus Poribacteria bacterium]MDE0503554.1 hypothetical protein [Candidatus Poribacteria bacterium]
MNKKHRFWIVPVACFLLFGGVSAFIMYLDDEYESRLRQLPGIDYFSEFTSGKIPMTDDNGENTDEFEAAVNRFVAEREEFVDSLPPRLKIEMHVWRFWGTLIPDALIPYFVR